MSLAGTRADFPSLRHGVHLNTGGMAPMPTSVAEELLRIPRHVAEYGPALMLTHDESLTRTRAAHETLARFLGADADEIAFTTQFSTGVNLVVEGLDWQTGDEIIVTDQEHPALLTPVLNIARRRGLRVRRLAVTPDAEALLAEYDALLNERTRLVAVSQVTTENGFRLPAREIARRVRARGALSLIDGAQAVGQIPVDVREIDCDVYVLPGYKWLFGPYPSAAVYIRRQVMDAIEVTWTGSRVTETAGVDMDSLSFVVGAERFEYGGRPFAYDAAMAAGVEYVANLGVEAIERHAQDLARYLHAALARVPGARVMSPGNPGDGTGIVTIAIDGIDGPTLVTSLRERWQIATRHSLRGTSVRVSIAAFTDEADLDRLVEGLKTLARDRSPGSR